jgi:3-oxoacyl-[acyl-carrier protein] reductase
MNHYDFNDRAAVITGGAAGIGLAVARRMAAAGARLSLWDSNKDALAEAGKELGNAVDLREVDISSPAAVQNTAIETHKALGKLDILVASAGITGPNGTVLDYDVETWHNVLNINLTGVFLCSKYLIPLMKKNGYGRIVNIASIAGKEGNPGAAAYSASKAGVIALTKSLAKEHTADNIIINCVTPTAIKTGLFDQVTQQHLDYLMSKIPLGRFGAPEEVASMVCWLASEECSYSTGAAFDLSGGRATY